MASMRVLRFPRSDEKPSYVLVNVSSAGPKPLDLKLTATEGQDPYTCHLKHDRVSALRVKNCPVSEEEWEHILDSVLQRELVQDIQVAAAVQPGSSISLTVRKQIQGITQRLGAITMTCDQSEQIELFQWCGWSLDALDKHRAAAADSEAKARSMEAEVAGLQAQLEELLQAKADDEADLLLKFRDLLNEKKVKIREQQKIISASSFIHQDPSSTQPQDTEDVSERTAPSRPGKRKMGANKVAGKTSGDSDEPMEDAAHNSQQEDTDPGSNSDGTASASDNQDDDGDRPGAARDTAPASSAPSAPAASSQVRQAPSPQDANREPPARRNLPFAAQKAARQPAEDADTESDDEL